MVSWGRFLLAVFLLGAAQALAAQESSQDLLTVTGQVIDARTEAPLEGAAIAIRGTELRAFTGADGRFSFRTVPPGEHVWVIDRLGYATWEQPFTAAPFDQLRIGLMVKPVALETIIVMVDRMESRRELATVPVHTVDREEIRSSPVTLAAELLDSRAPWTVVQCPVSLGATVYPLDQDNVPDESTLVDPGQRMFDLTQYCVRYRGAVIAPSVCLDDRPITVAELAAYGASEIYAIDFVGGPRPQARLYTERFLERGQPVRPFTLPCF